MAKEVTRIVAAPDFAGQQLYRVFFYSADPLSGTAVHPLDRSVVRFQETAIHKANSRLLASLESAPDFAVRRGVLTMQGWELGPAAARRLLSSGGGTIESRDIVPRIQQKGVDMRIGLDIASQALKRLVSAIALVTGDSDLVPAMKFARREGLRVYLDVLQNPHPRPELRIHADIVL